MKLVIGLGNPGPKYSKTRHNAGFMAVDQLAKQHKAKFAPAPQLLSDITEIGELILAKPTTFMNNSGRAVGKLIRKWRLTPADILVVYDDVDTAPGLIRYRQKGNSGGHNGIKSIIEEIGPDFPRLKIGVGKLPDTDTAEYVLKKLPPAEMAELEDTVTQAVNRIDRWDF